MHETTPKVYFVGQTVMDADEVNAFLKDIGSPDWEPDLRSTDAEVLAEMAGRLCYQSWEPLMNPNVTRVRKGNEQYLKHILEVGHEAILEHVTLNFILKDVSRVFTHELVRHRVGVAYSQESLRFVRLTDLGFRVPDCIKQNEEASKIFTDMIQRMEEAQIKLAEVTGISDEEKFSVKKELTSAFRRIAPMGVSTSIFFSCNIRELRHVILRRTAIDSEEEMRLVFDQIAQIITKRFPHFFQDMSRNEKGEWVRSRP